MATSGLSIYPSIPPFLLYHGGATAILRDLSPRLSTAEMQRLRRQQEAEAKRHQEAQDRSRKLFLSKLTPGQRQSFEAKEGFPVLGSQGNSYWISCSSTVENVYLMERGHPVAGLCAGPLGIPRYDFWLSQKLLIESDEETFRAVAVITHLSN